MRRVFADAGYFIAILDDTDPLHERAKAAGTSLGAFRMVTTQMVVTEVFNHMSGSGNHYRNLAVQLAADLEANPNVEVVPQTDQQFRAAMERYARSSDKGWGLTDCASFLVMEERDIYDALAHDRHFRQAEFKALMREDRD